MKSGYILAFITMLLWAIYDVAVRYLGVEYSVQPWVFVSYTTLFASFTLLIAAGKGKLGMKTLTQAHTWWYSCLHIIIDIIFVFLLLLISTTEANFMIRASIITSAILARVMMGRKILPLQYIGMLAIAFGVYSVAIDLNSEIIHIALFLTSLMVILQTIRTHITEVHPTSNEATTWEDESRVTGFVLLATSLLFLSMGFLMALFKSDMPTSTLEMYKVIFSIFPVISDFSQPSTIIGATLIGCLIVSLSTFLYFKSSKHIGSENFLMVGAVLPVFTYLFEYLASQYGLLSIGSISNADLVAGAVITGGAMFNVGVKLHHEHKNKAITPENNYTDNGLHEDYNMLCECISFYDNDLLKTAKALEVKPEIIENILNNKGSIGLDAKDFKTVTRNYRRKVATSDKLTGLAGGDALLPAIKSALIDNAEFALLFIDLDKFKPVNDTYGHEAGNVVLKAIASRLLKSVPSESLVARYGGDEFVVLLRYTSKLKAQEIIQSMQTKLTVPIALEEQEVVVGASFGLATSNDAKEQNLDALGIIKLADASMYKNKQGR